MQRMLDSEKATLLANYSFLSSLQHRYMVKVYPPVTVSRAFYNENLVRTTLQNLCLPSSLCQIPFETQTQAGILIPWKELSWRSAALFFENLLQVQNCGFVVRPMLQNLLDPSDQPLFLAS
jgi:hypothetical protein